MRVRGTMKNINSIEVNKDTVYIRSNIKRIDDEKINGWEYDEVQVPIDDYLKSINKLGDNLANERLKNIKNTRVINKLGSEISNLKLQLIKNGGVE